MFSRKRIDSKKPCKLPINTLLGLQIIGTFWKYYVSKLFTGSVASTQKEQLAKDNVNKLFRLIEIIAVNQDPLEITKDLVEIAIKKLKRKKAADKEK